MNVLAYLIPISLVLGGIGLLGFIYTLRSRQYDDPEGDSRRSASRISSSAPRRLTAVGRVASSSSGAASSAASPYWWCSAPWCCGPRSGLCGCRNGP